MAVKLESMLEEVAVEKAVGMVLAHDLTQIIRVNSRGVCSKKVT